MQLAWYSLRENISQDKKHLVAKSDQERYAYNDLIQQIWVHKPFSKMHTWRYDWDNNPEQQDNVLLLLLYDWNLATRAKAKTNTSTTAGR